MTILTAPVVEEFYGLCNWAYEVWLTHRELFDVNPRAEELKQSFAGDALGRLSIVTQEYLLHQIAKLHDPASQYGHANLSIDYVVKSGSWPAHTQVELEQLQSKLKGFAQLLIGARNKLLSHNDLATILTGTTLGAFPEGSDRDYFATLQEFVNIVYGEVIGGPAPFNDLPINDVVALLSMLRS